MIFKIVAFTGASECIRHIHVTFLTLILCYTTVLSFQTISARNIPSTKKEPDEETEKNILLYLLKKKLFTKHKKNVNLARQLVLVTKDLSSVGIDIKNFLERYVFLLEEVQNNMDMMSSQVAHMRAKVHGELEQELMASKEQLEEERTASQSRWP